MDPKTPDAIRAYTDTAIATSVVSTPLWLQWFESGLQLFMLVGGALLLILRLWAVYKELRSRKNDQ